MTMGSSMGRARTLVGLTLIFKWIILKQYIEVFKISESHPFCFIVVLGSDLAADDEASTEALGESVVVIIVKMTQKVLGDAFNRAVAEGVHSERSVRDSFVKWTLAPRRVG